MGLFMSKQAKEERKAKHLAIGNEIKDIFEKINRFYNNDKVQEFSEKSVDFMSRTALLNNLTNKRRILEVSKETVEIGVTLIEKQDYLKKECEQLINDTEALLDKYNETEFSLGCIAVSMSLNKNGFMKLKDNLIDILTQLKILELKDIVYELQDYIEENDK